jgi:hypothetical protein
MKRSGMGWGKWAAVAAGIAFLAGTGLAAMGCAIHTQAPIREIAYDFSDRDFYDRAYAPSPKYVEADPVYTAALAGPPRAERVPLRPRASTVVTTEAASGAPADARPTLVLRPGADIGGAATPAKPAAAAKPRPAIPPKAKPTK